MFSFIGRVPDAARVALAIDALCVGTACPILVHVCAEPQSDTRVGAFGLYCTPLSELDTLDVTTSVLERVTPPADWLLAGLCAPTSIRAPDQEHGHLGAWFVHVVTRDGDAASRLCVPSDHGLSGRVTASDHRLDRCLRRLVAPPTPNPVSGVWDP